MTSFTPKLYYFNIEGKGEPIRLACAYARYPLEDIRFKSRDEFIAMKEAGKLHYGQVPALEVAEGKILNQSCAIMRFIGKKTGLYPADDFQAAVVDSVLDAEIDLFTGLGCTIYKERFGFDFLNHNADLVKEARAYLNSDTLPRHLRNMQKLMEASSTGWIGNTEQPSIADFVLVPRLKWLISGIHEGIDREIISIHAPLLAQLMERFYAVPQIQEYYLPEAVAARSNV